MHTSPAPFASFPRGLKTLSIVTRILLWLVLAAWSLFALSWAALQLWIVPGIGALRPDLERWASQAVGVPVTVGEIVALPRAAGARGLPALLPSFIPAFELRDVRLYDAQGRAALQLPLVRTSVSVGSLWRLGVEQLVIERPVLDVRRTADGRIEVAGLDFSGNESGDGSAAEWFFDQPELVIQGGEVRWTDELRQQPVLALHALDLVVRNTGRSHKLRLDATPPSEWGERFSLRGDARAPLLRLGNPAAVRGQPWLRWDGELYADFPKVDVTRLRAYLDLSRWGVAVQSGAGSFRAWAELARGQITGVTADLDLQALDAQLGPELAPLQLETVSGRFDAQWSDESLTLSSDALQFRTLAGEIWPGGQLRFTQRAGGPNKSPTLAFTADRLDLGALSALATRLPLPGPTREWLASLQPAGQASDLSLDWQGQPGTHSATGSGSNEQTDWSKGRYRAKGRVAGLALASQPRERPSSNTLGLFPGRPGIVGATVDFDLNEQGGRARLSVAQGAVALPGVFEDPLLPLTSLEADASWRVQGERLEIAFDRLRLANTDLEGNGQMRWHTSDPAKSLSGSRFPGVLDLSATLTRARAEQVHRYLPLSVGPQARRYVREAVQGGQASRVDFRVNGDLWEMPFNAPGATGEFRIAAQLEGLDFAYVPSYLQTEGDIPWPALRDVRGELVLDRTSLKLSSVEGGLRGAPNLRLSEATIDLGDLAQPTTTLVVNARAQGPADEVLGFVRNSPVGFFTGQALERARISGNAGVQFGLRLPLDDLGAARVTGSVTLAGNDLRITPEAPLLGRTSGGLRFSEQGFSVEGAQAQLYGGPVRFSGGMSPAAGGGPPRIAFQGQGTASAEGLAQAGLGFVSRLFEQASGSAPYSAQLAFRGGMPELQVTSSLQGMAIRLPAPLGKSAEASLPLRYDNAVLTEADGIARTDRLRVQIGPAALPLVDLQYERDVAGAESRVLRGSIAVGLEPGESAPLPVSGVMANIRFGQIDVDVWQRAFEVAQGAQGKAATLPGEAAPQLGYLPTTLAVRAEKLTVAGRTFNGVVLGGSRVDTLWRANIDAFELSGYGEWRPPGASGAGSVYARLARLQLPPTAATEVEQLLQQPRSVPALDIAVNDLTVGERRLGRVEVQAVNRGGAGRASVWQLNRLQATLPEARLSATGNWAADPQASGPNAPRKAALDFTLDVTDADALLTRFGQPDTVRGGKGSIVGQLAWLGSPLALDYPSLSGQLKADFERGQFLKVEPGAAKLLGVLSLQALPRRLLLDFRDVFSQGFAFDFVRGDARIEQGVVFTNNLQMKGVNAAVLMEGSANIARETQDLKVVVVPELNAGTASLIATVINPAIGLGTFLAQFLLRQPLQAAATQQFQITGGWADPQVEKVERSTTAPVSPATPAPPPRSTP
jgi:uncharacterized protein (TIGR02099 family)